MLQLLLFDNITTLREEILKQELTFIRHRRLHYPIDKLLLHFLASAELQAIPMPDSQYFFTEKEIAFVYLRARSFFRQSYVVVNSLSKRKITFSNRSSALRHIKELSVSADIYQLVDRNSLRDPASFRFLYPLGWPCCALVFYRHIPELDSHAKLRAMQDGRCGALAVKGVLQTRCSDRSDRLLPDSSSISESELPFYLELGE